MAASPHQQILQEALIASGHVETCCLIRKKKSTVKASSIGFEPSNELVYALVNGFKDLTIVREKGISFNGASHQCVRADKTAIYGKKAGGSGFIAIQTSQFIIYGSFSSNMYPSVSVEVMHNIDPPAMYHSRGLEYEAVPAQYTNYHSSSSAGTFSREDYSQWKTHNEQFSFNIHRDLAGANHGHQQQIDGRGKRSKADRKMSSPGSVGGPPPPVVMKSSRGELVGARPPLRPSVSQPAPNYRRDEMVTPMSRVYPDRTSSSSRAYHRQQVTPHDKQPLHIYHQQHVSRAQQYAAEQYNGGSSRRERKRSVSPQIERKHVLSSSSSSQTAANSKPTEGSVLAIKKPAKKHVKRKIDLECHTQRVKTFELEPKWPKDRVLPTLLASYGFYYTGQEDITKCYSCSEKVYDWNPRDDPLQRHFEKNPNCKHIRSQYHYDIEEYCCDQFRAYGDSSVREASFNFWPIPRQVKVSDLVRAGWFYTGKDVITQCFTCGCVYNKWNKGDDPVAIHRQQSDRCSFLKQISSIDFSSMESRLQSFKLLPIDCQVTKEKLAEAGFHLIGTHPLRVKCWSCDLIIDQELIKGDDPMRVHKLRRPSCKAVQGVKEEVNEEEEDVTSFPHPIMTRTQLMKKYQHPPLKPDKSYSLQEPSSSKEGASLGSNVFNAPIHLPPGHYNNTSSHKLKNTYTSLPPQKTSTARYNSSPQSSLSLSEEDKLCVVCLDSPKQYAIVPCGHLCVCQSCSQQLIFCPICRVEKEDALRIFDS